MQELASVVKLGNNMAALGFQSPGRRTEGLAGIFDEVLNAMMASATAEPSTRTEPRRSDFSSVDTEFSSRARAADESASRRNAGEARPATGAEGSYAARNQNVTQPQAGSPKPDASTQTGKAAQQAKTDGAENAPKPWDAQSQNAAITSGANPAATQQPASAQSISNGAPQQTAQAPQQAPDPNAQAPVQVPVSAPNTDVSGDSQGGTSFDGKGSANGDAGNVQNARSDAAAQSGDVQQSEFSQKLSGARSAVRADQAETIDKIVKSMTVALKRGESEVRIMLQPAKLGAVRIDLSVKDGVLNASFETQTQAARHAISGSLPQLKAALESQGIEVGGFNVTVEQESGQPTFTDEREAFSNFSTSGAYSAASEDDETYDIFDEKRRMSAGTSLVDYFV
jgi:flagellar hook-length control protein FliK